MPMVVCCTPPNVLKRKLCLAVLHLLKNWDPLQVLKSTYGAAHAPFVHSPRSLKHVEESQQK